MADTAKDPDLLDDAVLAAHDSYRTAHPISAELDLEARKVMPGGNTRSVLHFNPYPFRVERAN